jgi:hypothetical protein
MQWYVSQNGKTTGPFTEQRIEMLVNWGKLSSSAYLCDDKWSCWVSITRSHFAPMLAARAQQAAAAEASDSEPTVRSLHPPAGSSMHQLALVLLIMLAAVAFALAFFLSPDAAPGPMGYAVQADLVQLLATTLATPPAVS